MKLAGDDRTVSRTVLVVDDDRDTREVVAHYFRRAGYHVRTASNGQQAMAMVTTVIPDVVILDMRMPELDGVGFLEVVRSYLRWATLPVVILSAYTEGEHIERAKKLGVRRVFRKADYRLADVRAHVEELLRDREASEGAERVG